MSEKKRRSSGLLAAVVLGAASLGARADDAPTIISAQGGALERSTSAASLSPPMPSVPPGSSTPVVPNAPEPASAPPPQLSPTTAVPKAGRNVRALAIASAETAPAPPAVTAAAPSAAPAPDGSRGEADESRRTALTALLCVAAALVLAVALKRRV